MSEIKTYPEMNVEIKKILRLSLSPMDQYAAQRIEDLEALTVDQQQEIEQLKQQNAVIREVLGLVNRALETDAILITFKMFPKLWERIKDALSTPTEEYHNPADVAEIQQRGTWVDNLTTRNIRLINVLKRLEWAGKTILETPYCIACNRSEKHGHVDTCELALLLRDG